MLWKRNLDKKFQGVEECYICYSILHSSNYQIPKLSCRTCHKKFHSSCLVSTLVLYFRRYVRLLTAPFCCCSTAGSTQATTQPVRCAGTCSKVNSQDGNALPLRNFFYLLISFSNNATLLKNKTRLLRKLDVYCSILKIFTSSSYYISTFA